MSQPPVPEGTPQDQNPNPYNPGGGQPPQSSGQVPGYTPPSGGAPPPPAGNTPPPPPGGMPPPQGYPQQQQYPPPPPVHPTGSPYAAPYDPNAPYGIDPVSGLPFSEKQKVITGVLNILISGVGRMYAGHVGLGIAQLAVAIVTCGVGALWSIIDGILILVNGGTDGDGRPLRD